MKKSFLYAMTFVLMTMSSCNKNLLDVTPTTGISGQTLFSDYNLTQAFVNNNYRDLTYGFYNLHWQAFMLTGATDETLSAYESYAGVNIINKGNLDPSPNGEGFTGTFDGNAYPRQQTWANNYNYIAQCNQFFANVHSLQNASPENISRMTGEMKALRAFRYFNLVKHYGGTRDL